MYSAILFLHVAVFYQLLNDAILSTVEDIVDVSSIITASVIIAAVAPPDTHFWIKPV